MRTPIMSPIRRVRPASMQPASPQPGENLRGACLMTLSMVSFGCNDAIMKLVTQELPLYQSIFMRGMVVIVLLCLILQRGGGIHLTLCRRDRWIMALRVIGETGSTFLFLNALQHMPIGNLSAIMQSLPLGVMVAGALVFKERLGWRRGSAVIVGLIGVIILRPGGSTFDIWSVLALASMLAVALRDLATRSFSPEVGSATISLYAGISVVLIAGALSVEQGWVLPRLDQSLLLLLSGSFLTIGYLSAVSAMRVGEISYVAPFRYASLLVAILAGLILFGEWPDLWTWVGAGLVVSAGIYTILREAQLGWRR